MALSSRETEIKLAFASAAEARERLSALGATILVERVFEDNRLFDRPEASLRAAGAVLRLRIAGAHATITLKTPVPGEHRHKVRNEFETEVGNPEAALRILETLGYGIVWRYQKYRTTLAAGSVEATIDETPIGCWVELEGEPEAIDRVAADLGFSAADYIRASYLELAQDDAARRGVAAGHLVFESPR